MLYIKTKDGKNMQILSNSYEKDVVVSEKFAELEVEGKKYTFSLSSIKPTYCLDEYVEYTIPYQAVKLHNTTYFVYTEENSLYITSKLNKIWHRGSRLFCRLTRKYVRFYGKYTSIEKSFPGCDKVFLEGEQVGEVKRPFKWGRLKSLAFIKFPLEAVNHSGEIHSMVTVGSDPDCSLPLAVKKKHPGMNYFSCQRVKDHYYIIRSTVKGSNIRIVNIPMTPEYTLSNRFKNFLARVAYKLLGNNNSVLLFEKETAKANESGYYVFEKIMSRKDSLKSKVYFVIDKHCNDFEKVYSKYPKNTLKKYSLKHYINIYRSKCFISSELSNHVINPRLYIKSINKVIAKKPLVFLQHGIMFAKPVDNPAAAGFKKTNSTINFFKCIISSDLEATQFHKLGFSNKDLIKCGLPKFDVSRMDKDADKILVMLTYRYWEEALVMNPETINQTTYYNAYMEILDAFEKEGLLDRVIISCHPKFAECIINAAPKYESIVEKDINKALESSKVFITDYSSASYDAHYRGAYVIYYWKERDYLIENYQAIPPVNEDNSDGVPTFSIDALVGEVKKAIANDYKMDAMYQERYKKINEFDDNRNGDRLVDELLKLDII